MIGDADHAVQDVTRLDEGNAQGVRRFVPVGRVCAAFTMATRLNTAELHALLADLNKNKRSQKQIQQGCRRLKEMSDKQVWMHPACLSTPVHQQSLSVQ